jgi:hypothetical protein
MRYLILFVFLLNQAFAQTQKFVSSDIDNFWIAYDKIISTNDTALQRKWLNGFYLDKGTPGLKAFLQVRNYTDKEFIDVINKYPKFWKSARINGLDPKLLYPEIEADIAKLKKIYPSLQPGTIYFSVGAFRSGGTIFKGDVLIGSELSLADESMVIDEFPDFRQNFIKNYKPKQNIGMLAVHEYIHTQQKGSAANLLTYCMNEGVAEFISCLATGKPSNSPAISFGKANQEKVVNKFLEDIFFYRLSDWLWGENSNELKERDLGYYIGYEICERYYNRSADKLKAVKELIELDYSNEAAVERIVDETKLFPVTLKKMWADYNAKRPTVVSVAPFQKNEKVSPGLVQISITFSEEMDTNFRGFDYGPLGGNYSYVFKKVIGWSNQNKTFTLEVEVTANKKYQTYITSTFRNKNGIRLNPFLMEFETGKTE